MVATQDLAVVISAGGWHTPPLYAKFIEALKANGIQAECPLIPTLTITEADVRNEHDEAFDVAEPAEGWPTVYDDTKTIQAAVKRLADHGKKVIIAGHSMGGFAATQAATPEFMYEMRKKEGLSGGVVGIFYLGAFLLPTGMSVNDMVGAEVVPPYTIIHKHGFKGLSTPVRMREFFLAGVSEVDAEYYASKMRAQTIPVQKLTNDPFKLVPTAYVLCKDDKALPPEAQEQMCAGKLAKGAKLTVFREPFDHSPFISATDRLVELLEQFAASLGSA